MDQDVTVNDAVAFVVEVAVLALLAVWGFRAGESRTTSLLLGVGLPAIATLVWGVFAAPRSRVDVLAVEVVVKVLVLGAGVLAGFAVLPAGFAVAFAVLVAVNTLLLYVGPFAR